MKKILILLLLILPIVNAQNPQIIISSPRDNYASLETFQAEIFFNIDPVNEIAVSNFVLTDNLNNIRAYYQWYKNGALALNTSIVGGNVSDDTEDAAWTENTANFSSPENMSDEIWSTAAIITTSGNDGYLFENYTWNRSFSNGVTQEEKFQAWRSGASEAKIKPYFYRTH